MTNLILPNGWTPRPYQINLWKYLEQGGKRAVEVAHRRWGKDDLSLHWTACAAMNRIGTYWHLLPMANQARKAIWEAVNPHTGKRRIDEAFPPEIRETTREQEMFIRFINGSTWQVVGSDNYNALVGSPPVGIVFSEWALADPQAWPYMSPILEENGGWAIFIYTPRGRNHGSAFYEYAKTAEGWFAEKQGADATGVFSRQQLERIKSELVAQYGQDEGMSRYRQEYEVSFDAAIIGSYYGSLINDAENDGRITKVPYNPACEVITAWDLGYGDSTAIWFAQVVGKEPRIIDYYEASNVGLDHYVNVVKDKKYNYRRNGHYLPHDAGHGSLRTGKTLGQQLEEMGLSNTVLARTDVDAGIQQVRQLLPQCWFDSARCGRGIETLRNYQRKWDEKRKVFSASPLHDWASDGADAMRYMAIAISEFRPSVAKMREPEYSYFIHGQQSWMG